MNKLRTKGLMLVLSAPSGGGKSSLAKSLIADDKNIQLSISATTREPRKEERDGVDYYFYSKEKFDNLIKENQFLEYAQVFDNYYGTPKDKVLDLINQGTDVLFDIDGQGGTNLKKLALSQVVTIFILPPSLTELRKRLTKRGDKSDTVDYRMQKNKLELIYSEQYDYLVINESFNDALYQIKSILTAERAKRKYSDQLVNYLKNL